MAVINKKGLAEVALGGLLGFSLFWLTSHQKSPVNKRLPKKRVRSLHYSPRIIVERNDKHYIMHHWTLFGISYLPLLLLRRKIKSRLLHGFFIGSILQGLTYKDRFKFVKPLGDFAGKQVADEK